MALGASHEASEGNNGLQPRYAESFEKLKRVGYGGHNLQLSVG